MRGDQADEGAEGLRVKTEGKDSSSDETANI